MNTSYNNTNVSNNLNANRFPIIIPPAEVQKKLMKKGNFMLQDELVVGSEGYQVKLSESTIRTLMNASYLNDGLPKYPSFLLPPLAEADQNKYTLVLDMDETLLHCQLKYLNEFERHLDDETVIKRYSKNWDHAFRVKGAEFVANLKKRPGVDDFMRYFSERCEIVVWTAGEEKYANRAMDFIDPTGTLIKHRLFRHHCMYVHTDHPRFLKDLSALGRDLSRVIILENNPGAFFKQISNGFPIRDFVSIEVMYKDFFPNDVELDRVTAILIHIFESGEDVREKLRDLFNLEMIMEELVTAYENIPEVEGEQKLMTYRRNGCDEKFKVQSNMEYEKNVNRPGYLFM